MTATIVDALFSRAQNAPESPFLTWQNQDLSFGAFAVLVRRAASCFVSAGVQRDERVAIHVRDKLTHLVAYFGAMAAGAIAVHLWSRRTPAEAAWACQHVGATVLVSDMGEAPPGIIHIAGAALFDGEDRPTADVRPTIAYMMFTSGTTSAPKAVMTTHGNVAFVTQTMIDIGGLAPADREIIYMPLHATGGLGHIHGLVARGASGHLLPHDLWSITDDELHAILDLVEREGVNSFLTTISLLDRLRSTHRDAFAQKARGVRSILVNIAPLPTELVADLISLLPGTRFVHYYGSTEASRSVVQCFNDNPGHYHCAGRAARGTAFTLDRDGYRGAAGEGDVGEVLVTGPQVMLGYWDGAVVADDGRDRTFRTGDLGTVDDDGFLTILGRVGDNLNIDGLKVFPHRLEAAICSHPDVAAAVVVGLPDPRTFETPAVAVQLTEAADRTGIAARLLAHWRDVLDPMLVPTRLLVVDDFPRGEQGKVLRKAVAARIEEDGVDPRALSAAAPGSGR